MIKPLLHRVLLKLDDVEEVTAGGIIISKDILNKERKAVETATVVAIGPTAFVALGGDKDTLKVGDRVSIARYSGKEVTDGDEKYIVINDEDILVLLGEDNA